MNKLLISLLLTGSINAFAASNGCDLSLYIPAFKYQEVEYQQEFMQVLKNKGYKVLKFSEYQDDFSTKLALQFHEQGVFRVDYKASMQLLTRGNEKYQYHVLYQDVRRTFGRDQFIYYRKMIDSMPKCENGRLIVDSGW